MSKPDAQRLRSLAGRCDPRHPAAGRGRLGAVTAEPSPAREAASAAAVELVEHGHDAGPGLGPRGLARGRAARRAVRRRRPARGRGFRAHARARARGRARGRRAGRLARAGPGAGRRRRDRPAAAADQGRRRARCCARRSWWPPRAGSWWWPRRRSRSTGWARASACRWRWPGSPGATPGAGWRGCCPIPELRVARGRRAVRDRRGPPHPGLPDPRRTPIWTPSATSCTACPACWSTACSPGWRSRPCSARRRRVEVSRPRAAGRRSRPGRSRPGDLLGQSGRRACDRRSALGILRLHVVEPGACWLLEPCCDEDAATTREPRHGRGDRRRGHRGAATSAASPRALRAGEQSDGAPRARSSAAAVDAVDRLALGRTAGSGARSRPRSVAGRARSPVRRGGRRRGPVVRLAADPPRASSSTSSSARNVRPAPSRGSVDTSTSTRAPGPPAWLSGSPPATATCTARSPRRSVPERGAAAAGAQRGRGHVRAAPQAAAPPVRRSLPTPFVPRRPARTATERRGRPGRRASSRAPGLTSRAATTTGTGRPVRLSTSATRPPTSDAASPPQASARASRNTARRRRTGAVTGPPPAARPRRTCPRACG